MRISKSRNFPLYYSLVFFKIDYRNHANAPFVNVSFLLLIVMKYLK